MPDINSTHLSTNLRRSLVNTTNYKLASADRRKIASAARKAMIAADSQYYAWAPDQQERFRATMCEDARERVQCVLLESLMGIKCARDKVNRVWGDIPVSKLNVLNWTKLLTEGIGEDYIFLNECMAEDKSLLDFTTLYDYDYNDYLFQEQALAEDFPEYQAQDYFAYKHPSWVRLLISGQFCYATFLSLAGYLSDEIDSAGSEHIKQLIPHNYVDGKDNGKPEKGGFLLDIKIDAGGLEGQLDELKSRWHPYIQQRFIELSTDNRSLPAALYTQDQNWDNDPHRFFIFHNEATLKKIRWRSFLSDCTPLMIDFSAVADRQVEELEKAKTWLAENHQDIMDNFDPDVIKLRKKRKVVLSAGVLNEMAKFNSGDEPID